MEDKLIHNLKNLKNVKPEDGFLNRSRQSVTALPQRSSFGVNIFESFKLATAMVLASVLLFVALGGLAHLNPGGFSPAVLTGADAQLKDSDSDSDFHIQLGQIEYDLGDDKEVGANLDQLIKDLSL